MDAIGELYVIGGGGFALQMHDTLARLAATGRRVLIADDAEVDDAGDFATCTVKDIPPGAEAVITIANPDIRRRVAERRPDLLWRELSAGTAIVSPHAEIAPGAILADGVIVEMRCRIGRHFQANLYSYVAHQCVVGDYVTLAPRVSCNGNVRIGNGVYIGTGAMIRQGTPSTPLVIGDGAFIGMGAIITRDVPSGAVIKAAAAI